VQIADLDLEGLERHLLLHHFLDQVQLLVNFTKLRRGIGVSGPEPLRRLHRVKGSHREPVD